MDLIITGASGVLGASLLRELEKNPNVNRIYALSRFIREDTTRILWLTNRNFLQNESLLLHKNTCLINLAFSRSSSAIEVENSIDFFHHCIHKAVKLGIKNYINVSSQSVYNPTRKLPASETDSVMPQSLYGAAKYYSELWLDSMAKEHDLNVIHLRLSSLIGSGLEKRITSRLLRDAMENQKISIKTGNEVFSFLSVDDAAKAILKTLPFEIKNGVFNVGTSEQYNLLDIANTIANLIKKHKNDEIYIQTSEKTPPYHNNSLCTTLFEQTFQWTPSKKLVDSLEEELLSMIDCNIKCNSPKS